MKKNENMRCCTPYLVCKGIEKALAFYEKVFGAKITSKHMGAEGSPVAGKCMHAEMQIDGPNGPSVLFLCEEFPDMGAKSPETLGGTPVSLYLYTPDCDASYKLALDCGAKSIKPPENMFWGDRWSLISDPCGHHWSLCTKKEDVSEEGLMRRQKEMTSKMTKEGTF